MRLSFKDYNLTISLYKNTLIIKKNFIKYLFFSVLVFFLCYNVSQSCVRQNWQNAAVLVIVFAVIIYFLQRPKLIFLSFIFFLPYTEAVQLIRADFANIPNFLGLVVIIYIIYFLAEGEDLKFKKTPIDIPVMFLLIVILFSIFQSRFIPPSYELGDTATFFKKPFIRSIFQFVSFSYVVLLFYVVSALINNKEEIRNIINIWILSAFIICVIGLYGAGGIFFNLPMAGKLVNMDMLIPRVSSLIKEPMFLGVYLISILPVVFSLILARSENFNQKWLKINLLIGLIVMFATMARGAWMGIFLSFVIIVFYYFKLTKKIIKISLIVFGIIIIMLTVIYFIMVGLEVERFFVGRFLNLSEDFSTLTRIDTMIAGLNMFKAHPVLGVGIGNYLLSFIEYAPDFHYFLFNWIPGGLFIFPAAHNLFINFLAETGVLGTSAVVVFFITIIIFTIKSLKVIRDDFYRPLVVGYLGGFYGILFTFQFFSTITLTFIWIYFSLMITIQILALKEIKLRSRDNEK